MIQHVVEKPVRVGVCNTVEQAEQAVGRLLQAGFPREQLAVICSHEYKDHFFRAVPTPEPSESHTVAATVAGGIVGAAIGGLALAATPLVAGGAMLLAYGTALIGGGAVVGSFSSAMLSRGVEKENAGFYDQAVQRGKILVAVEIHTHDAAQRLAEAEHILAEVGAHPFALEER